MTARDWCVMRQDDNGNRFVVASALTEPEARLLSRSYEARGHKQLYWIEPMADAPAAPSDAPRRAAVTEQAEGAAIAPPSACEQATRCPVCNTLMQPGHAHERCATCGDRDSC